MKKGCRSGSLFYLELDRWLAGEGLDGAGFVVLYVEDGVELGDLEQVVNLFGEVQELQFAALVTRGGVGTDELADARAVNVVDVTEIEQDVLLALGQQVAN